MTTLALPLSAYSGPTGEDRSGFRGGVCAKAARGLVMPWFGHPSVVVTAARVTGIRVTGIRVTGIRVTGIRVTRIENPRLVDRQDGQHDIGAGVRGNGETR